MKRVGAMILAVVALVAVLVAAGQRDNPLIRQAQDYAQTIATTAAATYVTLRTLNAFLSTVQEIEIGGSLVVSGSAQPLKVLEPIDDTIEMVATMVFGIMVATGILAVALGPVSVIGLVMVALAIAVWMLAALVGQAPGLAGLARRLGWYGGFLGLALPLALVVSAPLAGPLTEATYLRNVAVVSEITQPLRGEDDGFGTSFARIDEYRQLAGTIWNRADDLIGSLVAILAVYVFRIFILPLLMIGGMFMATRHFARGPRPA